MRRIQLTSADRERIIEEACKLLGTPYCLRGDGRSTFNCSQFVTTVIKNALGIDLPAKVDWLYLVSTIKQLDDLRIGDLVFFRWQRRPKGKIVRHVAIFLGNGQIIHAPQRTSKVVIEPIEDHPFTVITHKDPVLLHQWIDEIISLTGP